MPSGFWACGSAGRATENLFAPSARLAARGSRLAARQAGQKGSFFAWLVNCSNLDLDGAIHIHLTDLKV